jgi:glycosyltransferase involved in cell wall biosynthesis
MSEIRRLVILPCHNEEASISATIAQVRANIPNAQIWVIDNDCSDNTAEIALDLGVQVIKEPHRGKGFAIRKAFSLISKNQFDVVFMTDGDDTYSLSKYLEAEEKILCHGADMVIGHRIPIYDVQGTRKTPFRYGHVYGNKIFLFTHLILFGTRIEDPLSGWRLMSSGFVKSFLGGTSKFEIEAELNAHAYSISCNLEMVEVEYSGRALDSYSKLNTYSDGIRIIRMQLRLFRSERPALAFSMLALPWFTLSCLLMYKILRIYSETNLVPHFPSLIAAVGAFIVSGLLWTSGIILRSLRLGRIQTMRSLYNR